MWNANIMLNKLFRSSSDHQMMDDMDNTGVDVGGGMESLLQSLPSVLPSENTKMDMKSLLQFLPSENTEMDIYNFSHKDISYPSLSSVNTKTELNKYVHQVKQKIKDLRDLEWNDTFNNFVDGKGIIIVHKSLETKLPEEKKGIIAGFIHEKIGHFEKELEDAKSFNPISRSKSTSTSFALRMPNPTSAIKKEKRSKSSLGKSLM